MSYLSQLKREVAKYRQLQPPIYLKYHLISPQGTFFWTMCVHFKTKLHLIISWVASVKYALYALRILHLYNLRYVFQTEDLASLTELVENQSARTILMVHRPDDVAEIREEIILRVQGYLVDAILPPVRRYQCMFFTYFVCCIPICYQHSPQCQPYYRYEAVRHLDRLGGLNTLTRPSVVWASSTRCSRDILYNVAVSFVTGNLVMMLRI